MHRPIPSSLLRPAPPAAPCRRTRRPAACLRRRHRAGPRKTLLVFTGLLALAAAGAAPRPATAQGGSAVALKTVEAVRFEGRHHVPVKELRAVLKTRGPGLWPWSDAQYLRLDFLRADSAAIEEIYRQHGFLDVRAAVRLKPGQRRDSEVVTFAIDEGERCRIVRVDFVGLAAVTESQLRRRLYARPGRAFNPLYLLADTARIAAAHRERGYLPRVGAGASRDSTAVRVAYFVAQGPQYRFGEVHLSTPGRAHVKSRLALRELTFRTGEIFKASRVQESIQGIYATGLFSQVQMTPLPDSSNRLVEFDLRLRERPPRWLDAGIGSGTSERLRATGEWGHRNVDARGRQTTLSSTLAFDGQAKFLLAHVEASLYDPWLLRARRRGLMTLYYENSRDRADSRWVVKQETKGVKFEVRREYRNFTRLVLTQDNSYVRQHVVFNAPSLPRDSASIYSTHLVQLALERDSRDDLLQPSRGSHHTITGEIAGGPLRGTSSFTKLEGVASWYLPMRRGWVLATHARSGVIDPFGGAILSPGPIDERVARVPLEDRFRIGGVNSLRGYNENELPPSGGLAIAQANVELRVPLVGPLGAEFFLDGGNVWSRLSFVQLKDFGPRISQAPYTSRDVRYVCGVGARLNLPFGPLRFDVSWSAQPELLGRNRKPKTQFAIGPTF